MASPNRGISATVGWVACALWGVVVALWLADIRGARVPPTFSQAAVLLALATLTLLLTLWARRTWQSGRGGKILLALLALSLAVHLIGAQFELLDHPRSDEGVYLATAQEINGGNILPATFNYGHLFYYLPALALWIQNLFLGLSLSLVEAVLGLSGEFAANRILLRGLAALLGALTVLPVFAAARRAAGLTAATLAGLLILLSTNYTEVAQTVICDVPAGFFAALCLAATARLLDGETTRDYLLAGAAAGLAAASKYPGGVSAVAIVAMWCYWRLRARSWSWGLLWSGLAALGTFLAAMPALAIYNARAFSGRGLDVLFGWRQYAYGGWLGVMPPQGPARWYGERMWEDFGPAAVLLGLTGLFLLAPRPRRRMLVLAVFPVIYLVLIGSMNMVVGRNMQPLLPGVAVLLGIGCSGWMARLERLWKKGTSRRPQAAATSVLSVLVVLVMAIPAWRTVKWVVSHNRPGTRELMRNWIEENVPHGAGILKEDYTPQLSRSHYLWSQVRSIPSFQPRVMRSPEWDYVLLADTAHYRFLDPRYRTEGWHDRFAERYETLFSWELAHEVPRDRFRSGPRQSLYRIDEGRVRYRNRATFTREDVVFVSDPAILPSDPANVILFSWRWQFAVFKEYLRPGTYEVHLWGAPGLPEAYVHVVTPDNREIANVRVDHGVTVTVPEKGKYLIRVFQVPGTELRALELRRRPIPPGAKSAPGPDSAAG